jgi:superoxide dismutase
MEDPRVTKDGVTTADLREQFEHNLRVRDLVSDVNRAIARLKDAQKSATGEQASKLKDLSADLITPSIRYSKPELQTHILYLYSLTTGTDQKIGRDAIARYNALRKELNDRIAELDHIAGQAH